MYVGGSFLYGNGWRRAFTEGFFMHHSKPRVAHQVGHHQIFFKVFLEDCFSDLHVQPKRSWKTVWQQYISVMPFCRPNVKEVII